MQRTKQEKSRQNEPPNGSGTSSTFCLAHARCWWDGCACTKLSAYCFLFYYRNTIQHYCQSLSLNIDTTPVDQRDPPLRKGVKRINSLQAWAASRIQIRKYVWSRFRICRISGTEVHRILKRESLFSFVVCELIFSLLSAAAAFLVTFGAVVKSDKA
jgi:hypothetical protein